MAASTASTRHLLRGWHGGRQEDLESLLGRDLEWIRGVVRRAVGHGLAARAELDDYVQDAIVRILQYAPKVRLSTRREFRRLIARIVTNTIRGRADEWTAARRNGNEVRLVDGGSDSGDMQLSSPCTPPPRAADRNEWRERVEFAVDLLAPDDREVLRLRVFAEMSFDAIADRLGIGEEAARKRFARAMPRLAGLLESCDPPSS